jgi:hypothetical protein
MMKKNVTAIPTKLRYPRYPFWLLGLGIKTLSSSSAMAKSDRTVSGRMVTKFTAGMTMLCI